MQNKNDAKVIATDLDGTLIPFCRKTKSALEQLKIMLAELGLRVVFVTGRSIESACEAIDEFALPFPEYVIADVGSRIYDLRHKDYRPLEDYDSVLSARLGGKRLRHIATQLIDFEGLEQFWDLKPQEQSKQTEFKCSFYCRPEVCTEVADAIRLYLSQQDMACTVVSSVDPDGTTGLIDLLPAGVDKGFSLTWWATKHSYKLEDILFFGDSGNDLSAFRSGVRSTIVGNAAEGLFDQVKRQHPNPGRIYQSEEVATAGVVDGIQHFVSVSA